MSDAVEVVATIMEQRQHSSTYFSEDAQSVIDTLKSLGWLPPADLEARDKAVRDAALEMAAEKCAQYAALNNVGIPNDGMHAKEKITRELFASILALKSTPATGMKLVPVADLQEIAKQRLSSELIYEVRRDADFEGAYDIIVSKVRAMLAAVTVKP